ncbi:MAG: elongation factor G [Pirellulaceae bacterium]
MARQIENIRNIGIIAHIDAGKTTVTERMLYLSGFKHRPGGVDKGTTETDEDPEEQQRGITIYAACVTFPWKTFHVNLLDTPGHVDFTAEVERCLRVLDGAVVVFSAREGVEAQSETVWRQADKYEVPRVVFINKLDREGADFESVYEEIRKRLGANPIAVTIPVGQGPPHIENPFRGVIDLIRMRMLQFTSESEGKEVIETEVPEEELDRAEFWRAAMLEELYRLSDEIASLALQEQPIPEELIRKVLREAAVHRVAQPLLCGSALHGIGVQPVLDAVGHYLPSPLDRPPVEGLDPKNDEKKLHRKPDADEPFCGLVFKILPAKTGDTYWVRVYSGTLKANSRAFNPTRDKRENVAQLWQIHATRRERDGQVPEVTAGDIVGVVGPRESITGDTLCDIKEPILLPTIQFADTVISMAIEPESTAERKKLAEALEMLKRQDPTFKGVENEETGQTLISGMGELHLEVIKHRLLRDFNLDVRVHKPRVSYRETVDKAAQVVGECHRQHAGQQLFAKLTIKMEPYDGDKPVLVINRCPADKVPIEFLTAALDELRSRGEGGGVIGGFPLTKLKITILDGEAHLEGSNEMAFTIAAGDAFMKGLQQAGPVLLEPIMRLEISTPEEYFGAIDGDLQQRRGYIVHNENRGDRMVLEARAPLSELFGYSSAIRSLSQGRASNSMEPLEYASAPPETAASFGF